MVGLLLPLNSKIHASQPGEFYFRTLVGTSGKMANVPSEASPQGTLLVNATVPEFRVHAGGVIL